MQETIETIVAQIIFRRKRNGLDLRFVSGKITILQGTLTGIAKIRK